MLHGADVVFVVAGMGDATGTAAAPVLAKVAKAAGAVTIAIVTRSFDFEGRRRKRQAEDGIAALEEVADHVFVIPNQRLLAADSLGEGFRRADDAVARIVSGLVQPGGHWVILFVPTSRSCGRWSLLGRATAGVLERDGERRTAGEKVRARYQYLGLLFGRGRFTPEDTMDRNVCELCDASLPLDAADCDWCGQPVVRDARGSISIWRLDDMSDGLVGRTATALRHLFNRNVVVQPGYLTPCVSQRRGTANRLSADAFLEQIERRHNRGTFLTLGMTEQNIASPPEAPNFVFGLGRMDGRTAVMSFHQLRGPRTPLERSVERGVKIAVHELGHALGLEHHEYADKIACTMNADVELDCVPRLDRGTADFCKPCRKKLERRVGKLGPIKFV